ncbi:FeoA family protein [Methanothermobacter tenebrarum]|uniref:Ferrous iron transport protein A n=1 Tax=Methanothermobacter tenebrarum TaxID=680118 RepID=A0A328PA12_9EURY|nr:FeoA family protein [Methanothermobacter tenebrarum]MBC7101022.1 ferrous iron transport protein A [Methanobacteriales archaeon]MBC7117496.1 ferrous iron transport protein A [Methanobacteriaceae archaeon]NPV64717.1 ferrous iron transport protein A [Methanobacteriaceae archaeon]RAO79049.1 ferrous iron transport protein A [Methanothermobacter tenebrarum]
MITLKNLKTGKNAIVREITGGIGLKRRLESLNIRVGKKIRKVSTLPFRGPIIIEVDNCKIAIGRGMAGKILVEVIDENTPHGKP